MVNILGLHFGHDGSACIVRDGRLVSAISTERLTGEKKQGGVVPATIDYVLKAAGIGYEDIDMVALSDYIIQNNNGVLSLFDERDQKISLASQIVFGNDFMNFSGVLNGRKVPVTVLSHHICHAASSFFTSNVDESVVFTMDGCGGDPRSSSLLAHGKGNKLNYLGSPNLMVGVTYGTFTSMLGLGPSVFKAGSTMGLASYGKPLKKAIDNKDDYISRLFFENYDYNETSLFHELFEPDERISKLPEIVDTPAGIAVEEIEYENRYPFETVSGMNAAATIQYLFEESIMNVVENNIKSNEKIKDVKNICLAGGSFLNCNANSVIRNSGHFDNVHLFPAAGDDGICVGAALYVAHHLMDYPRINYTFSDLAYMASESVELDDDQYKYLASEIANGKIVAWCSGQSEY
jgi:carbamoyltransferase